MDINDDYDKVTDNNDSVRPLIAPSLDIIPSAFQVQTFDPASLLIIGMVRIEYVINLATLSTMKWESSMAHLYIHE